jgi:hypothetical protein
MQQPAIAKRSLMQVQDAEAPMSDLPFWRAGRNGYPACDSLRRIAGGAVVARHGAHAMV